MRRPRTRGCTAGRLMRVVCGSVRDVAVRPKDSRSQLRSFVRTMEFLYPIEDEKSAHFYFGIPDEMLATDNKLMQKIKTQVKRFSKEGVDTGYSVHSTELDGVIVLCAFYSAKIQD